MQPWFQLSHPQGAKGKDSLLLSYPFEFLAFVPVTAWKKRHWPVFLAGVVMMLILWTITPLQGAILGTQAVTFSKTLDTFVKSGLIPVDQQAIDLDVSILDNAYGTIWYEQDLAKYTTKEYALLPFFPADVTAVGMNETWTANTTKFETDLDCWPANFDGSAKFDNGKGCSVNVSVDLLKSSNYYMQYFGYVSNAVLDWQLGSEDCGPEFSHEFFSIFASRASNNTLNITAMFCEPSYIQQEVTVTVQADTRLPVSGSLVELSAPISMNETIFNSTAFEFLLHVGFAMLVVPRDYGESVLQNQNSKMVQYNITWPATNMVGFGIGSHDGPVSDFQSHAVMQAAYGSAHKLMFANAVSAIITQTAQPLKNGTIRYILYGMVVSRPLAIVVECILAVVAILTGTLLYTLTRCHSNLCSDPDSIASIFGMLQHDESLLASFSGKDNLDEKSLLTAIGEHRYCLRRSNGAGMAVSSLHLLSAGAENITSFPKRKPTRPKVFSLKIGVLYVGVLSAAIGGLIYLKHQEVVLHDDDLEGTEISALSVSNSLHDNIVGKCIGHVKSLKSTTLSRSSLIPDGGFSTLDGYYDHFEMVRSNVSADTRLPTWLDSNFAYFAFADLYSASDNSSAQYQAGTRGFGLNTTCHVILSANDSETYVIPPSYVNGLGTNKSVKVVYGNVPPGNATTCSAQLFGSQLPEGQSALEVYNFLMPDTTATSNTDTTIFCQKKLLLGWVRYDTAHKEIKANMNFMSCESHVQTAMFNLTVDADGRVLNSIRVSPYAGIGDITTINAGLLEQNLTQLIADLTNSGADSSGGDLLAQGWHNDTFTRDWMNYLLEIESNSTANVDPSKPLPQMSTLVPAVQQMIQRLGAALLNINMDMFDDSDTEQELLLVPATKVVQDTRIFLNQAAFTISVSILGIYIVIGVILYVQQRRHITLLPRLPTTIGSVIAYVAASRAVRTYSGRKFTERDFQVTYSFGRYIGTDGKMHIGIELDPRCS
ncbi:hypothetical protein N0V82_004313 [Gnomoniopsis sp. IMI 355080]|nr:hypothetical protein N0V82_004313 [Gnomoniopsis sp. IMI 355080]